MNKCDFCVKQMPNGDCYWVSQAFREPDCEIAIQLMVQALNGKNHKDKRRKND